MTGEEILYLAGELLAKNQKPSEALARTIIGRAYYGVYHLALDFMVELGFPRTSDHLLPAVWLRVSGHVQAIRAGDLLTLLYESRQRADYRLTLTRAVAESRDVRFVRDQVEMATDVKSLLTLCRTEPARSQVQAAIAHYRQQSIPGPQRP